MKLIREHNEVPKELINVLLAFSYYEERTFDSWNVNGIPPQYVRSFCLEVKIFCTVRSPAAARRQIEISC